MTTRIEKVSAVFKRIGVAASETNLLAINAVIEGGRAGSASRGFTVVAGVVLSLTGQAASVTWDITEPVEKPNSQADRFANFYLSADYAFISALT